MTPLTPLMLFVLVGCSHPTVTHRQPTDDDAPFGGGFPASHKPGGDMTAAAQRRGEVRVGSPAPGQQSSLNAARREPVELEEYVRQQRAR